MITPPDDGAGDYGASDDRAGDDRAGDYGAGDDRAGDYGAGDDGAGDYGTGGAARPARLDHLPRMVVGRLRRPTEAAGAARPTPRLRVTPTAARRHLPRPGGFPLTRPTWPGTVARPPLERTLGVDYDSDWARRAPARAVRLLINEAVTRPLVAAIAAPTVTGLDRIAHLRGPAIFAANHASHVDAPLLISVIPEPWRHRLVVAGAADYFFDTHLKASVFALTLNAVPVERQRVDRSSAKRLSALLDDGWSLVIFPEGGRTPDGWAQPHRGGAGWLAARTGRPIVPVHVEGTRRVLPRHATRLRPGPTTVTFGRPLRGGPGAARELAERVERAVAALADERATDWWTATRRAAAGATPALTGPDAASPWRRAWALGDDRRRSSGADRWPED